MTYLHYFFCDHAQIKADKCSYSKIRSSPYINVNRKLFTRVFAVEPSHALSGRVDDLRVVCGAHVRLKKKFTRPAPNVHKQRKRTAIHAADECAECVPVGRCVLQGWRREGERAATPDRHAHAVDKGAQPSGRTADADQPTLG